MIDDKIFKRDEIEFCFNSKNERWKSTKKVINKKEIPGTLLLNFFPSLLLYLNPVLNSSLSLLQILPIIKKNVGLAIFLVSSYFVRNIDDLPLIV